MNGMGPLTLHQGEAIEARGQGSGRKGIAAIAVDPVVESLHVEIRSGGQMEGLGSGTTAAQPLQFTLLPMQKNLVIFENRVVAQVL